MKTLYEELGDERLAELLHTFYDKVFASEIIGDLFKDSDQEKVKHKQFCFLTQFLGGPPRYNQMYGHPRMRMRHMPHRIDEKAKDEWLKLMKESIWTLDLSENLKEALYNCFPKVAQHMQNTFE